MPSGRIRMGAFSANLERTASKSVQNSDMAFFVKRRHEYLSRVTNDGSRLTSSALSLETMRTSDMDSSLQVLWEDGERVFCRGWRDGVDGDRNAGLAVHLAAEHPTPGSLNRLTHEYGLKDDLDDAWAVRPLELARERGRTMLVLKDPGGEPLHRLLGPPVEVARFLRLAVAQS